MIHQPSNPRQRRHDSIRLETPRDVMYWTGIWGLSDQELREAVAAAGPEPIAVASWLGQPLEGEDFSRPIPRTG